MKFDIKNVKMGTVLQVASVAVGIAGMILGNKKEAYERDTMKTEIMEEVVKNLSEKKD